MADLSSDNQLVSPPHPTADHPGKKILPIPCKVLSRGPSLLKTLKNDF
jgi:hypothetical protein